MATTTNYGWTTPDDTALVKDGASAIRTLGSSVDTTTKALNPETTLGDLAYRSSTANVKTRLGLGTAGQVLQVNSGATAPEWGTIATDPPTILNNTAGRYITPVGNTYSAFIPNEDETHYAPIYLSGLSFDRISIRTSAGYSGTSAVRLGVYNASKTTGKPTTVLFDAGTVSVTAASTTYEITITQTPAAGYYFLAFNVQTYGANPSFNFVNAANSIGQQMLLNSRASMDVTTSTIGYLQTGVTGAFATAGTLTAITAQIPIVGLRVA
jgi:hypothetical protein